MKKYKVSFVALFKFLACLVVVIIFIVSIYNFFPRNNSRLNTDKHAIKIEDTYDDENSPKENDTKEPNISSSESEHSAIVVCAKNISIDIKRKKVSLFYQNPSDSKSSVKLELYLNNQLIAASDSIPAGYELDTMDIDGNIKVTEGTYQGFLKTIFINPQTLKEENFNSGINVLVNIKDK